MLEMSILFDNDYPYTEGYGLQLMQAYIVRCRKMS